MTDDQENREDLALDRLEKSIGTWVVGVTAVLVTLLLLCAVYLLIRRPDIAQ